MYKRILAFFMIVVFSISTFSIPSCVETTEQSNNQIRIVTPTTFNQLFSYNEKETQATKEKENDSIKATYDYTLTISEDTPNKANATFNAKLMVNSNMIPISTSGILSAYHLSNGTTIWHGPLKGKTSINNSQYIITVGFTKFESSNIISASVTIQSDDENNIIDPVMFSVGEDLITTDILYELRNSKKAEIPNDNRDKINTTRTDDELQYLTYKYANFARDNFTGIGQRARAYFSNQTNRLAVSYKSYCDNVDKNFQNTINTSYYSDPTEISEFSISLQRGTLTTEGASYIVGTESNDFSINNYGTVAAILPLFEDALGLLSVPTSTISSLLGNLDGTVERTLFTDVATVTVEFGIYDSANFDDLEEGIPIIFQLERSNQNIGSSTYTFATDATYRTFITYNIGTVGNFYYTQAQQAAKTVTITLGN